MKRYEPLLKSLGRLLFILFILLLTFSFAMFQGGFVSWFIFYMALPFALYSMLLMAYPLRDMEVSREVHTPNLRSGGRFSATVSIRRSIPFPLLYTVFSEVTASPALQAKGERQMVIPGFRRSVSWTYEIDEMPRGEHVLDGIQVEIADFFGWVRKSRMLAARQLVLVYPKTTDIAYRPIEASFDQGSAASPFTPVKDTTVTSGIRNYQPGDRVSWIHWKSFARTQTLHTKDFEDRQSQDLFILEDRSPSPSFEAQVELTASILQSVVRANSSAAYLSVGGTRAYFPSVQSEEQLQQAMVHLMKVKGDLPLPLEDVIAKDLTLSRAASLLYITGTLTAGMAEMLQRNVGQLRTCLCLVVKNKGERLTREEEAVHQSARSRGFSVKVISPGEFNHAFMEVGRK